MDSHGTKLVRRTSGGGAVYHDKGNCNYAMISPLKGFHRDTYALLIAKALQSLSIEASVNSRHDIIVDDKKISFQQLILFFTFLDQHIKLGERLL